MSSGTGFLVSADGAILTAFHIVDGAKSMKAVDVDGRILAAKVVAAQPDIDMALLEVGLAPGRYRLRVGLGRPARGYPTDPQNLSVEGTPVVVDHITTDAAPMYVYEGELEVLDGRLSLGFGGRAALTGAFAYTFLSFVSAEPVDP